MRCNGTNHDSSSCRYIETECDYCHKIGHIERACMLKKQKQKNGKSENRTKFKSKKHRKLHQMDETSESDTSSDELNHFAEVNSMDNKGNDPMYVSPRVNGVSCRMQIDTGSARSIITLSEFKDKFPGQELKKTSVLFKTYTGQLVQPNGKFIAHVKLHGQKRKLPLFVVPNGSNALLGRDWLRELQLNWAEVKAVSIAESINSVSANKQVYKPETDTRVLRLIDKHKSLLLPGV